jgi:agmatine deiminase
LNDDNSHGRKNRFLIVLSVILERLTKLNAANVMEKIQFHIVPHTTYWTRDFGPIFVVPRKTSPDAAPKVLSFPWTSWGYKWNTRDYDVDGADSLDGAFSANAAASIGADLVQIQGFASEGGDREFNGRNSLIICEDVQLQRNPGMSKQAVEQKYNQIFGCTNILWMKTGLADDRQIFRGVLKSKTEGTVFGALATGGHVDEVRIPPLQQIIVVRAF